MIEKYYLMNHRRDHFALDMMQTKDTIDLQTHHILFIVSVKYLETLF